MTFNPIAALNVLECKNIISNNLPNALDLGSQTASIDNRFIENLINQNKIISNFQKQRLTDLNTRDKFNTKDYFISLGFEEYKSIDINGAYGSFQFDLVNMFSTNILYF